jgi:predicted O-methyltransferase YrrM
MFKVMLEVRKTLLATFPPDSLNTTAGDAMMLRILIEATRAKRGIEVGTNAGYGAINMGIGFERTGGRLYSVEIDPRMAEAARQNLEKAGLERTVSVIEGDALTALAALEGQFDFVFIDARKKDYLKYLRILEPKLERGATVVADNVIGCAEDMPDFLEYIQSSSDYDTVIIRASMEKNDGMSVSFKIR